MVNSMVLCLWCLTSEQMAQGLGSIFGLFVEFLPSASLVLHLSSCSLPTKQTNKQTDIVWITNNRGMKGQQ